MIEEYLVFEVCWQFGVVILYKIDELFDVRFLVIAVLEQFVYEEVKDVFSGIGWRYLDDFQLGKSDEVMQRVEVAFEPHRLCNLVDMLLVVYCAYLLHMQVLSPLHSLYLPPDTLKRTPFTSHVLRHHCGQRFVFVG